MNCVTFVRVLAVGQKTVLAAAALAIFPADLAVLLCCQLLR
jgi:hypothetical protein